MSHLFALMIFCIVAIAVLDHMESLEESIDNLKDCKEEVTE